MTSSLDFSARRAAFRKLHESGCFVIPNPWDAGSGRYLQHLGFKALATTSAGFAFSVGLPDAAVPRDAMLRNIADIVAAVDLPVNADFESGYASDLEGVAASVRLCVEFRPTGDVRVERDSQRHARGLHDERQRRGAQCVPRADVRRTR